MGTIFSLLLVFSFHQAGAYDLPLKLEKMVGQTFSKPGPNCFAAALYGADVYSSFRAVSADEFSEVLKTSCQKTEKPQLGDIGVYSSNGFGFVHAFVYLDKDTAFEKPGVDYVGKTPVRVQDQESVDYIHLASPECRRWGDESCHNTKTYYRCNSVQLGSAFENVLARVNELFDKVLIDGDDSLAVQNEINGIYWKLEIEADSALEKAVLESVEAQMLFFGFGSGQMLVF